MSNESEGKKERPLDVEGLAPEQLEKLAGGTMINTPAVNGFNYNSARFNGSNWNSPKTSF